MASVNTVILERMASHVPMIPELAGYLVNSGGKRLRPMLTLASARLCGYGGEHHVRLAAAVEFIHTATLLHDDVVDESDLRRGKATANRLWGNQPSVLVGDFLFSRSFQLMVATQNLRVLDILSNAAAVIAEGEVMQLSTAQNMGTTEDTYLKVIEAKTAALFAAACQVGAVIAGRPGEEEDALFSYGRNLGIAFQLVDDALDYAGARDALGKNTGDDFREGKITLPVVLAYRRGSESERAFWRRVMEERVQHPDDLAHAADLMRRHRAIDDTMERARHYGSIATDALAIFPDGVWRNALGRLVGFCISRTH
ncbi:MAG: polyprenyl synthetase family protein [Alphaproteobacteria bacterium]|nr:polyprenyl synthetase family protein [Alphaproteobacteria bacterium]